MAALTRSRGAGTRPPGQAPRRPRRRSVPLAAGGVVLVVVCALVFAEGWLDDATGTYRGRPVDVAVGKDGSLFVSDDFAGAIYRITYSGS